MLVRKIYKKPFTPMQINRIKPSYIIDTKKRAITLNTLIKKEKVYTVPKNDCKFLTPINQKDKKELIKK